MKIYASILCIRKFRVHLKNNLCLANYRLVWVLSSKMVSDTKTPKKSMFKTRNVSALETSFEQHNGFMYPLFS